MKQKLLKLAKRADQIKVGNSIRFVLNASSAIGEGVRQVKKSYKEGIKNA